MKHTLLKFLADTMDYEEVIHGVEELNNDQLVVIFEKLKAQLAEKQHKKTGIADRQRKPVWKKMGFLKMETSQRQNSPAVRTVVPSLLTGTARQQAVCRGISVKTVARLLQKIMGLLHTTHIYRTGSGWKQCAGRSMGNH